MDFLNYCESSNGESQNGLSPSQAVVTIVEREVAQYCSTECQLQQTEDPLQWWEVPTLAHMACKYLCIQATSVSSEHMFSSGGNIVSRKRCPLSPENVDCFLA